MLLNETGNSGIARTLFQRNIHRRRRKTMNTILNRIDRLMMAVTFAEANEPELTQESLGSRKPTLNKRTQQATQMPGAQIMAHRTAH